MAYAQVPFILKWLPESQNAEIAVGSNLQVFLNSNSHPYPIHDEQGIRQIFSCCIFWVVFFLCLKLFEQEQEQQVRIVLQVFLKGFRFFLIQDSIPRLPFWRADFKSDASNAKASDSYDYVSFFIATNLCLVTAHVLSRFCFSHNFIERINFSQPSEPYYLIRECTHAWT